MMNYNVLEKTISVRHNIHDNFDITVEYTEENIYHSQNSSTTRAPQDTHSDPSGITQTYCDVPPRNVAT